MKKEESIKNIVDVVIALLQTIILALIPVFFQDSIKLQVSCYSIVFVLTVLFLLVFRDKLIENIILALGINVSQIKKENLIEAFKMQIVPNSQKIKVFIVSDQTDKYFLFRIWKETSELVALYFTSDFINKKLVKKKAIDFSRNKVYKQDVKTIVDILINCYTANKKFEEIIDNYKCKTLKNNINDLYDKLVNIEKQLHK